MQGNPRQAPCEHCCPSEQGSDSEASKAQACCCNTSCVEVAAQRECDAECGASNSEHKGCSASTKTNCCSGDSKSDVRYPCEKHAQAAQERYTTLLEAAGCICKALIARNLESCCNSIRNRKRRSGDPQLRSRASRDSSVIARSSGCSKSYPSTGVSSTGVAIEKSPGASVKPCGQSSSDRLSGQSCRKQPGSCCSKTKEQPPATGFCSKDGNTSLAKPSPVDGCKKACCGQKDSSPAEITPCNGKQNTSSGDCCSKGSNKTASAGIAPKSPPTDIEQGTPVLDHVVLSVEGLTCVGCENKLYRALNAIPGIQNLKTSLVMAQAEFDVGADTGPIEDVIQSVTKTTGFTCQRLSTEGISMDVLVPGDAKEFINREWPNGVTEMAIIDRKTVRITYNPSVVGARDLLNSFDAPLELAALAPSAELTSGAKHVRKTALMTALSVVLTVPVLIMAWAPLPDNEILYGSISLALATIVQVVVAGPFYPSALKALLFTRVIEMDLLIVMSTSAAYVFSVVAFAYQVLGQPLSTGEFFETSTLLVTLIMVGRLVSAFARHKAVESISIRSLQPDMVRLVDSNGLDDKDIDTRLLHYGDTFKVIPDSKVATDGIIINGESEVDESTITGEPVPVFKSSGSKVVAGCLNGPGTLTVRLTRLPGENTISQIAAMVDAAKFSKPKIQELADRVASYFVPVIVALTVITFIVWIAVGIAIRHQTKTTAVVQAITYAIAVLIVSCPCAIGLAVPMVVVVAGGVAANRGVVFKSAEAIETARNIIHIVFDKTGTLTEGKLAVIEELYLANSASAARIMLGLIFDSKHPVSVALATHLKNQDIEAVTIDSVKSLVGRGMEGTLDGAIIRGGNSRWLNQQDDPNVALLLSQGLTVFCLMRDEELLAAYGLEDSLRPESISVIRELHNRNVSVSIVSGDEDGAVHKVAHQLSIPSDQALSRYSPEDKQEFVKALMEHEKIVMFCGDGTNDAVALAQAHIGLHISSGTDVAQSAADAVLVRPNLRGVLTLIDLSKAAFHRIVFNFAWSFIYNLFAVLLASGAFVNARIPPEYAGLGELVSVLPVILIALQLRWFKR